MKIVVSVYMFHRIIFLLWIVSSLSCNFNCCVVCFQLFMKSFAGALKTPHVSNIFEDCTSLQNHKIKNKYDKFFIMLKGNSIDVHSDTPQLATGWPYRWFWIFFSGFAKSRCVLWSSWILNECNLYFKIVKYCCPRSVW